MSKYELTNPLFRQIFLFLSVGVVCYFISIILLMFLVEVANIDVNLANAISSVIVIFICYLLNAKFVFKGGRYSQKKEILAFFVVSFFGFLLNVLLMFLMTEYLAIWYVISKTVVTISIAVFNFVFRKRFVFLQ
ncbi:Putative flippase GtrA (transmembrane translocase of bactoprenol-linked glucose) [Pricia antarctica]|uniref:Putative flippase GtrA (Transmembrane translocase of bactoprenol-linked glucose) n=1 Tax=Pricia antarctica TaxID=641691 RepID=A0A1G6YT24_9FLAO|nr:Putative flippase GtrA (transmembrane translocase of bactoprenol-linked glucose) [Pricia antarctica]